MMFIISAFFFLRVFKLSIREILFPVWTSLVAVLIMVETTDVVFAVAARCFFATVLDAVGAEADHQFGVALPADVAGQLAVGRPIAARRIQ